MYSKVVIDRFWSLVDRRPGAENCWKWTGRADSDGMGFFAIPRLSSAVPAHRIAYRLTCGDPPAGYLVWRECRNVQCVNPRHLRAGDRGEFARFVKAR